MFPLLRRRCQERGVAWSEVDLRWGVTDEQAAEGAVLRSIVPGETHEVDGVAMVEVISGLVAGDVVVPADEVGHE